MEVRVGERDAVPQVIEVRGERFLLVIHRARIVDDEEHVDFRRRLVPGVVHRGRWQRTRAEPDLEWRAARRDPHL